MVKQTRIAFRADASLEIGTGHVMRCLTLAEALRENGAEVLFISRVLPGNMIDQVEARGFPVKRLPESDGAVPASPPAHAPWAGVDWRRDAAETGAALDASTPDWLVVDHYAFDDRWEKAVRRDDMQIMVIDDLADRPHDCDLLLDQNLGHEPDNYKALVPSHCKLLIGPTYALLRPEFAELREESLDRRRSPRLKRLLITMGGMDKDNATSHVLDALRDCPLPDDLDIEVVMGGNAPWLEVVKEKAATMPWPTYVRVDIPDMAQQMAKADLAIGAAGSTTWERCCLGLPAVSVQIAENQSGITQAITTAGAALDTGPIHANDFTIKLQSTVSGASDAKHLAELSAYAAIICDGEGVRRVIRYLLPGNTQTIYLARPASMDDAYDVWRWRNAESSTKFYRNPTVIPLEDHLVWFANALEDPGRILLMVEGDEIPLGHVRLDRDDKVCDCAEMSIYVNPEFRGKGHGKMLLEVAMKEAQCAGISHFSAEIHEKNAASIRIFRKLGFRPFSSEGGFLRLVTAGQTHD